MKKGVLLTICMMVWMIAAFAMADTNGEAKQGKLYLFQKCDESLIGMPDYDAFGCPTSSGPWPLLPDKKRWGRLHYSLWGETFKFSFSGRGLEPERNYTLIYYPDPWPGNHLICLGSGTATPVSTEMAGKGKGKEKRKKGKCPGNLNIQGDLDIGTSLPAVYDANYTPLAPSGAMGAKIWLVPSEDVQCTERSDDAGNIVPPHMLNWNPASYLFEYNLINFEYRPTFVEPY